jgi:catecholate siderophore receptor
MKVSFIITLFGPTRESTETGPSAAGKGGPNGGRRRSPWVVVAAVLATAGLAGRNVAATPPGDRDIVAAMISSRRLAVTSVEAEAAPRETYLITSPPRPGSHDNEPARFDDPIPFDIPPGPLVQVVEAFERASGWIVEILSDVAREMRSPGVSGRYTPEEALRRLLENTGVSYELSAPRSVKLDFRVVESVDVTVRVRPEPRSPKYTTSLLDTPQTVTIVPQQVFEEQNATTLRDVLRNVSGISIQAGEGGVPAGDNLSIRGFNARTDLFVDGVRDFGGYSRDPFNFEQVEVVKGPSSVYGGRGSTGGSVNMATKTPNLTASNTGTFGLGNASFKRATLDINQPLESLGDGVAFRLNAMWTNAETPGRDVASNERWGLSPSLALGLGRPTRLRLGYFHLGQGNVPDYGVPWVPSNNTALPEYADQPAPVDYRNFYGLRARDYEKTKTHMATVSVDHDFGASLSLDNLFRYGVTDRDSIITAPRFASTDSTDIRRTDMKSRGQEDGILANQTALTIHFTTGSLRHAAVTGIELSRERSENFIREERGPEPPNTDLFAPNPNDPYAGVIARTGESTRGVADSLAMYTFDTVDLGRRWQVRGGLRWERFETRYETFDVSGGEIPDGRTDAMLSWRGGLVYKPRPNGSVYVGAGNSFNPSAEGLSLTTRGGSLAHVEPETSESYEVGTKWDVASERLSLSTAIFRTEKTNARTPGLNPGDPPRVLDGRERVQGVELGFSGNVTEDWLVFGGYTFMDSRIEASNDTAEVGNAFGNTPRHSFNVWTSFQLPWNVELGGGAFYVGDRYNGNSGTRLAPGYWQVDAMAALRLTDELTLRVNAVNLANERFIDRVGGGHFIPGVGRSVIATTSLGF